MPDIRLAIDIITVKMQKTDAYIGTIYWFPKWRHYVFEPASGCVYNARCLDDIRAELVALMDAWARATGREPRLGAPKFGDTGKRVRPRRARSGQKARAAEGKKAS